MATPNTPAASYSASYITATAAALTPGTVLMTIEASAGVSYMRLGVVEVDIDALPEGRTRPHQLSERSRGVVQVLELWERLPRNGTTPRSRIVQARDEARELVAELNRARP